MANKCIELSSASREVVTLSESVQVLFKSWSAQLLDTPNCATRNTKLGKELLEFSRSELKQFESSTTNSSTANANGHISTGIARIVNGIYEIELKIHLKVGEGEWLAGC